MKRRIIAVIITSIFILMTTVCINAEADSSNVSYNCNVTQVSAGDEVRLEVSTREMSICTFIAYVKFDSNLLEYQGFEGAVSGEDGACLAYDSNGKTKYRSVNVELSDDGTTVGMYMVGTTEVSYKAGTLATLLFRSKSSGAIEQSTFESAETSDGSSGYTSESIRQAAENNVTVDDGNTQSDVSTSTDKASNGVIIAIAAVVIIAILIIAGIIIYRKKNEKGDSK